MTKNYNYLERTELLIGTQGLKTLKNSNVILMGVGGVGSFVLEALVRSGIGTMTIVDYDKVELSNINRQIIAYPSTVGKQKVDVAVERGKLINPDVNITGKSIKISDDNINGLDLAEYDYVIDAIDDIKAKISLIKYCKKYNIRIISAMGAGLKLDPTKFEVSDIYKTSMCPLARILRRELKKEGIKELKVVYSKERPQKLEGSILGTMSFVPSAMGLIIAGEVIKDLLMFQKTIE